MKDTPNPIKEKGYFSYLLHINDKYHLIENIVHISNIK